MIPVAETPFSLGRIDPPALGAFLGREVAADDPQALTAIAVVAAYASTHTRGRGFESPTVARPDVAAVILAAAARLYTNPEQLEAYTTGDYSARPAVFRGWTLVELATLNRWRQRAR